MKFLESKTNVQILLSAAASLALILTGIAIEVLFDKSVFEFVALGVGKLFGDSSVAAYRNVKVDGPIRAQQAALDVVIAAKAADVPAPMPEGLQTWKPAKPEEQ